ncbi:hypothetical protein ACFW7O_37445, partial [Streptomyces diastatochromogenes]
MSDGRREPGVPRPESDATAGTHAEAADPSAAARVGGEHTTGGSHDVPASPDGGFTDPAPDSTAVTVQGSHPTGQDSSRAIGPKQDDPRAIGPKQDDPRAIGPKQDDPRAIGPKQDDPRA